MSSLYLHIQDKKIPIKPGQNLFEFLRRQHLPVQSSCGGMGTCGKCRVKFVKAPPIATLTEQIHLSTEALEDGLRLSCMHTVETDLQLELFEVDLTTDAKQQLHTELDVVLKPGIKKIFLEFPSVSRHDQCPDTLRVQEGLKQQHLAWRLCSLQALPQALRQGEFKITVTLASKETTPLSDQTQHVLDVEAGDTTTQCYGVAFDLGTTTIAGYLFDLTTGEELVIKSLMNPQRTYGGDVISRIKHVRDHGQEALEELHQVLRSGINALLKRLCRDALINSRHVYKTVFAGNPTILHFFARLDPSSIDHSPYIPVTRNLVELKANELNLDINPEGQVFILPNLAAYVGGDITAGVLATQMHHSKGINLLIDIGTNAEIVLGNEKRLIACSSPAGPAFEGAQIQCGMSANPGAISHVTLSETDVQLEVIGNINPKGICGSGLIDAVGQLLKMGLVLHKGNLRAIDYLPLSQWVSSGDNGQSRFTLSNADHTIYLSQKDIRELQLAKGAVRAGVDIVLKEFGICPKQLDHIYLAGAFGNFLSVENVLRIGLLPLVSQEKIVPVGNAAGTGACLCLLNTDKLKEIQALTEQMEYFELSNYEKFSDVFMGSMLFPEINAQEEV